MDYQLDAPLLSKPSSSCSIITSMDNNGSNNTWNTDQQFISLRCHPTLTTLPPELLSKISYNLSLCDYSFLSRTCSRLHSHLFHPAELVLFLKTRYRLSIQSGSIIIFAYLANMQVRAPLLLERIFEDFFADSPIRLQEEQKWKQHCQQQRQQLSNNTFQLNQAILSKVSNNGSSNNNNGDNSGSTDNSTSLEYQRVDAIEVHKAAEKARRQAKWDAVRMLGVLYALDKTHIGPSSSTNALVLSGACDPPDIAPVAPAPAKVTETDTETETGTEVKSGAGAAPEVIVPLSMASASAFTPAPIAPRPSYPRTRTTTITDTEAETDDGTSPSFMYHVASSSLSAACELSRRRTGQGPPGRSHSFQEGHGQQQQQDLETVSRSRSTSLDYSDLAPHHHHSRSPQPYQSMATHTRNVRKRPSPSLPSKDGKVSSSSSSSWWDSPLTQQHVLSDNSRFSPSRACSPPSVPRHHYSHSHYNHHQRQRSSTPFSPSSSSSLTSVFSSAVPGSRVQPSGGGAAAETATATAALEGGRSGGPSPTSPFPFATASSFSSTPTSSPSLLTSSSTSSSSSVQQEEARQSFFNRRNKRHVNLRAMKERAVNGDRETMEYVEYQSAMSPSSSSSLRDRIRRGCWTAVDQDQDFDMDMLPPYNHRSELEHERARSHHEYNGESMDTFGLYDQGEGEDEVPMDVDVGYGGSGSGSRSAGGTNEYIYCDSTTPTPIPTTMTMANKSLSPLPSSSSLSCPPPATFPTISPHHQHLMSNDDSSTPFQGPSLLSSSSSSSLASCSSSYSSACADRSWSMLPTERENESTFGATPLGISVPVIEANTNNSSSNSGNSGSGIEKWHGNGSGSVRGGSGGASSTPSSSWRMMVVPPSSLSASSTPSFLFGSQGSLMRLPRRNSQGMPQQQLPLSRNFSASAVPSSNNASASTSSSTSSTSTMIVTTETPTTTTTGAPQKMQQILNRQDKIAFLTKYTDRMHLRLQVLGIEDWGQGDIQRKKTYQLMIQHNDKTGEKDLVKFYLGRYGGSVTSSSTDADAVAEPVAGVGLIGLPLQQEGQGQQQQGTPVVVQA